MNQFGSAFLTRVIGFTPPLSQTSVDVTFRSAISLQHDPSPREGHTM